MSVHGPLTSWVPLIIRRGCGSDRLDVPFGCTVRPYEFWLRISAPAAVRRNADAGSLAAAAPTASPAPAPVHLKADVIQHAQRVFDALEHAIQSLIDRIGGGGGLLGKSCRALRCSRRLLTQPRKHRFCLIGRREFGCCQRVGRAVEVVAQHDRFDTEVVGGLRDAACQPSASEKLFQRRCLPAGVIAHCHHDQPAVRRL